MAAAIMAGAAVVGGLMSSSSAKKAAKAQQKAAEESARVQQYMYDQTRADQAPYRDVGSNALYKLADFYGLGYGSAPSTSRERTGGSYIQNQSPSVDISNISSPFVRSVGNAFNKYGTAPMVGPGNRRNALAGGGFDASMGSSGPYSAGDKQEGAWDSFFTSPDYQFRLDEGIRGIENSMLSRGKGLSGNTGKALTGYAGDLASGEWNNYANRLGSMAGIGQTATNQLGSLGSQYASNMGNSAIAAGQARGSGYIGQGDAWGNALSGVAGAAGWGNWGGNNSAYGGDQNSPNIQSAYADDWWGR